MTDTVIKPEEISDALFSCVYSWVNGHAIDKKGADAAVARHRDSTSPYGVLARRLCEFVAGSGPTYEELCDLGLVLTDASRQKENRIALVAEVIGDEVKQLLCDAERINRIFPQPKPKKRSVSLMRPRPHSTRWAQVSAGRCFLITMVDYWRFTKNRTQYTIITG